MKLLFLTLALTAPVFSQAPGVSIFEQSRTGIRSEETSIGRQAEQLHKDGKLVNLDATAEALAQPTMVALKLPAPQKKPLTAAEVAERAKLSSYRVGWAYLCNNCDNWHVNLAGGYALTEDGVLGTCAHVIELDRKQMREGGLIAVDHTGMVFPVTAVLANHEKIDGALIKIEAETTPLSLNDQVAPGDAAFCLSRPLKQGDYFTQGIVNRFYWNLGKRDKDPLSLNSLAALKLNVSTRWAPGSSGSAILDRCGNVIGHVATIQTMGKKGSTSDERKDRTLITLHSATPARAMMALARPAAEE